MSSNNKYSSIISKIEKIRSKNNVNWMDILRLAFKSFAIPLINLASFVLTLQI